MSMKTVKLQWVGLTSLGVWETGRRFLIYNMTYMYVRSTVTSLERPKVHNSCSSIILVCQIKSLFDIIVWYLFVSIFMYLQEKSIILQIHLSDSRNLFIFLQKKKNQPWDMHTSLPKLDNIVSTRRIDRSSSDRPRMLMIVNRTIMIFSTEHFITYRNHL